MKKYLLVTYIFFSLYSFSQVTNPKKQIELIIGRSVQGTGDSRGLIFAVEYSKYFKKKLNWSASIGATINDGILAIFYEYPSGVQNDGSIRYTTAGVQAMTHLGYDFLSSTKSDLLFKIGTVIRYQSSSYWDDVAVLLQPMTGLPYPVVVFRNSTPQRTVAIGSTTQIKYSFTTKHKISFGMLTGFQVDTNADTITHLSLTIGKRF
jgi:hypothetical protein